MNNLLLYVGGALVAVLFALFSVPHFVDWNSYRGVFEEEASRVLGRELRVGGQATVRLLPIPYVQFEKVRLADKSGRGGEPFFRADEFTMWLAITPLLRGAVEASEIELRRPILRLAADANGGGNWQALLKGETSLPVLPANVTLQSVRISDGAIHVEAPGGRRIAELSAIDGELSAATLEGPYKFHGTLKMSGAEREVRFSTSRQEGDGATRIKGTVRVAGTGSSYVLDARLLDLAGRPRLEGELSAKLPLAALQQATGGPAQQVAADAPAFDLKGEIKADALALVLSDLSIAYEKDGRPQLVTGELKADWRAEPKVDLSLASRWIDLDTVLGLGAGTSVFGAVHPLALVIANMLPAEGASRVALRIEQANLAGDVAGGIVADLSKKSGRLGVDELSAYLPGGSRVELAGQIVGPDRVSGRIRARGASLTRFATWLRRGALPEGAITDGHFLVTGDIDMAGDEITAKAVSIDVPGSRLSGSGRYKWGKERRLVIKAEGDSLDLTALLPDGLRLESLLAHVAPPGGTGSSKPAPEALLPDAELDLKVGRVRIGERQVRDLVLEGELSGEVLRLAALRAALDGVTTVDVQGDVAGLRSTPKGRLSVVLGTESVEGVATLAGLFGLPVEWRPNADRARLMVPLRLAGTIRLASRTGTSSDIQLDGSLAGSQVALIARLAGSPYGWTARAAEIAATAESGELTALLRQLGFAPATDMALDGTGRLALRLMGIAAEGAAVHARLEGQGGEGEFAGRLTATGNRTASFEGEVTARAQDAGPLLALAGRQRIAALASEPLTLKARVAGKDSGLTFEDIALRVAGSRVMGRGQLAITEKGRTLDFDLKASEASLVRLLDLLVDSATPSAAGTGTDGDRIAGSVWPGGPFDFGVLDKASGTIKLAARRMTLATGLGLANAHVELRLTPANLEIKSLTGEMLGGKLAGTFTLAKAPAGARLGGMIRIDGADLARLATAADGKPTAQGTAQLRLEVQGQALSPRGLIAALTGKGTLELAQMRLRGFAPNLRDTVAESVLKVPGEQPAAEAVRALIRRQLAVGQLAIGSRRVALEVVDGAIRAKPLVVEEGTGRVSNTTTLDLVGLKVDSEWRFEPTAPAVRRTDGAKGPMPALSLVYVGALDQLAALEPQLSTSAFEEELSIRRMERQAEELEKLRKLDEDAARQRQDRERQEREKREREALERMINTPPAGPPSTGEPPPAGSPRPDGLPSTPVAPAPRAGPPPAAPPSQTAVGPEPPVKVDGVPPEAGPPAPRPQRPPPQQQPRPPAKSNVYRFPNSNAP